MCGGWPHAAGPGATSSDPQVRVGHAHRPPRTQILQLPVSFHRFKKHPDHFPAGTHRVAWAFLRLSRPDLTAPVHPPGTQGPLAPPLPDPSQAPRKLLVGDLKLQLYR